LYHDNVGRMTQFNLSSIPNVSLTALKKFYPPKYVCEAFGCEASLHLIACKMAKGRVVVC